MAIQIYQPTVGLSVRDKPAYYTALKNFFEELASNNDLISVTFDDDNFIINIFPTDSNINARYLSINVSSTYILFNYYNSNDKFLFNSGGYSADISFFIYSDNDEFTIGINGYPIIYGIFSATNYHDGSKIHFTVEISNRLGMLIFINNTTNHLIQVMYNTSFFREAGGTTDVYRFIEFPLSNTLYICDNIFYVDGGLSLPPSQFTVNDVEYITFLEGHTNICYRLS